MYPARCHVPCCVAQVLLAEAVAVPRTEAAGEAGVSKSAGREALWALLDKLLQAGVATRALSTYVGAGQQMR